MECSKPFSSVADIARTLELNEDDLRRLATSAPKLYRVSKLPKPRGGFRVIEAPLGHLKEIQKKMLRRILNGVTCHPLLHSGPETSTKTAARVHLRQPLVVTLDIQDFFPSVRGETISRSFEANGFNKEAASLLTRLVTRKKRLPQGAPTSSAIARIVLFDLCEELQALLKKVCLHSRVTIYVDDVTISGPVGLKRLIPTIVSMFRRYGYHLNETKIKLMPSHEEQVVLGLSVNGQLKPSSEFQRTLDVERVKRNPRDPKLKGLESYSRFITQPS